MAGATTSQNHESSRKKRAARNIHNRPAVVVVGPYHYALIVAVCSMVCGLFVLTPYPKQWGWYKWSVSIFYYPVLVGMTPAHYYGEEWKFTHQQLLEQQQVSTSLLQGQHALVTGANSGIGYSIAKGLAQLGASSVTLACRNPVKCEEAAQRIKIEIRQEKQSTQAQQAGKKEEENNVELRTLLMDTSSLKSVQQAAQSYTAHMKGQNQTLDMLFLNAGTIFADLFQSCVPVNDDGIEYVFATNYLGHHLLYRLLEPLLLLQQQSKPTRARVVSTSSAHSFITYSYKVATDLETLNGCHESLRSFLILNHSYGQSKLAQILWTQELTRRLGPNSPIYVNAFHPGAVNTWIWSKALQEGGSILRGPLVFLSDWIMDWMQRDFMWSSEDGAWTGLFLGVHSQYLEQNQIRGQYFHPQGEPILNPLAQDEEKQRALWEFSESLIQDYLPKQPTVSSSADNNNNNEEED